MAEPEQPEDTAPEGEDQLDEVEDLEVADEEVTERVRGGRRAISIPFSSPGSGGMAY